MSKKDDRVPVYAVIKDGKVMDLLGGPDDVAQPVELWVSSSEKHKLEAQLAALEEQYAERRREELDWKVEYLLLRDRVENPHCYNELGEPTAEALADEGTKGGPIYGAPTERTPERRRVVTLQERLLELAGIFYARARDQNRTPGEQGAWRRAFKELLVLKHHSMSRPDLPLCRKCGGTGGVCPSQCSTPQFGGEPEPETCDCLKGFDPHGSVEALIDD
jgi:hypothetical protein